MKNIKRFAVILVTICAVLVCASCKNCSKDKEQVNPVITNQNEVFLKVGNFQITNNEAYYQLLNSYGLETLLTMVDNKLLPAVQDEEGFKEYLDEIIYGEEEKTDEALNEFLDNLSLSGLTKENYEEYYRLSYRRLEAAKKYYVENLEEDFTEEDLKTAFENLYFKNTDLVIIRFDSRKEANEYLTKNNIDLENLNTGWQTTDGKKLSDAEVLAVFENIYQELNGVSESGVKTYTYDELTKINATLANKAYNWKVNTYTKAPTMFGSQLFLAYKNAESKNLEDGAEVTFEDKKAEVKEYLIETQVTSTYSTMVALNNQLENAGLEIYDSGLEAFYKLTYDNTYSNLGIKKEDYKEFKGTDAQSDKNVFSYLVNGSRVYVTADELFTNLKENYGNYLAALYIKQYIVLKDNKVVDITNGTVLDQKTYDTYYKEEVKEYKDAFEDGDYASLGFDANYGWENFLRDYLGLLSEEKILINLDSTLYKNSYNQLKDELTLGEEVKDADGNVTVTVDQAIQDKMEEIFNEYLNVTAVGVKAYYDLDLNNEADELVEGEDDEKLAYANDLLALVYEQAAAIDEAIATALSTVILEYNLATKYHTVWGEYKAQGLELALVSSASYTAASNKDETILNQLREQYADLLAFTKAENGTDLSGKDLSESYTYTYTKYEDGKNVGNATTSITAADFVNVTGEENDIFVCENVTYLYYLTKVTKPYYINTSEGRYKPTRAHYETYLNKPSDLTTAVKNCITSYYIPAINELANETAISNLLMEKALELLANVTYNDIEGLREYINACIEDTNAE